MHSLVKRFMLHAEENTKVRPSELPFYENEPKLRYELAESEPSLVQQGVTITRQNVTLMSEQLQQVSEEVNRIYETGKAHSQGAYNQLLEEENVTARAGVIAGCGAVGLLVGALRGRMIKKLFYTTLGAGAGASLCYPTEAAKYSEEAYLEARKATLIAYNFVAGVEDSSGGFASSASNQLASSISSLKSFIPGNGAAKQNLVASALPDNGNVPAKAGVTKGSEQIIFAKETSHQVEVEGDPGQSNPEDKDMYTTR